MQKHFVITFGVVLVTLTGALAKKEPGVPASMSTQKQLALVRVNVTGQSVRLFSAMAKESAFFKARPRRCFIERPRPGNRRSGCQPKLRRTRARGDR